MKHNNAWLLVTIITQLTTLNGVERYIIDFHDTLSHEFSTSSDDDEQSKMSSWFHLIVDVDDEMKNNANDKRILEPLNLNLPSMARDENRGVLAVGFRGRSVMTASASSATATLRPTMSRLVPHMRQLEEKCSCDPNTPRQLTSHRPTAIPPFCRRILNSDTNDSSFCFLDRIDVSNQCRSTCIECFRWRRRSIEVQYYICRSVE